MRVAGLVLVLSVFSMFPHAGSAQQSQTLADIRQELSILYVEIQRLKRELSTTGSPTVDVSGGTMLDRINAIEAQMQNLTSKTEQLQFQVEQVVADGTNRIGDLEFRLVELEGGDVSALGETSTLGGGAAPAVATGLPPAGQTAPSTELAMGEQADFDTASQSLSAGNYQAAADQFAAFSQNYPGGPLAAEASLKRGKALAGLGNARDSARAYLESFSGDPTGPLAPEALFELGSALGVLEQKNEACVTLSEVGVRFPASPMVARAQSQKLAIGCP
jgi:tol-pal system protein YbgF